LIAVRGPPNIRAPDIYLSFPSSFSAAAILALGLGALVLLTAWLPLITRRLPLSLPVAAVGLGYFLLRGPWLEQWERLLLQNHVLERLTEFVILVALMGAGLRIQRPLGWRRWEATWRMLGIAMPLTILTVAALCWSILGVSWAAALLLGAASAPTDPVLAADVQIGPPGQEEGGETRFVLTSEAGLNDGLAFPFVTLAILLTTTPLDDVWSQWLIFELIWKIGCGAAIGYLAGRTFGWLTFKLPRLKLSKTGDGLVAVGVALISYGVTELAYGNGFIAVFLAAMTLRATDRGSEFHAAMAEFSEQIERVLMVVVLVVFGGAIAGGALSVLGWNDILVGMVLLLVIRPAVGGLSLMGTPLPAASRLLIAFFGIRGLGTFYYMAYAAARTHLPEQSRLWAVASFVVLTSILLHGITSTPLMDWADRRRKSHHESQRSS
jgi:NhaP-type Na+/H+ or K+/H+ antiporter